MSFQVDIKRGRNKDYLPSALQGLKDVAEYVRSRSSDEQQRILLKTETGIKAVAGEKKGWWFRKFSDEELEHLSFLLELRCLVLNEMALHPTAEEVRRVELLNDRLLRLTEEMRASVRQMQQWLDKMPLFDDWKKPAMRVEGWLEFCYDEELPALTFESDSYYGSDFNYMLELESEVFKDWKYPHEFVKFDDLPQADGKTWADGYLLSEPFQHLCICYALHALCCHLPYAIPDVIRMDNFTLKTQICYAHDYYDPEKERRAYYEHR